MEELSNPAGATPSEELLLEWLRPVQDPEMFMSLVDLGLIYNVFLDAGAATVKMTLTTPACPSAGYLVEMVKNRLLEHPSVEKADVILVFEPKWDPRTMASDEVKDVLGIW